MFVRPLESAELVKGSNVVLEGTVSGSGPFEISCYQNDKQIRNDRKHKIGVQSGDVTLQISNCEAGDTGNYRCTISNEVGETSCYCHISLKGSLEGHISRISHFNTGCVYAGVVDQIFNNVT